MELIRGLAVYVSFVWVTKASFGNKLRSANSFKFCNDRSNRGLAAIAKPVKYENSDFIYYKQPPLINIYFILSTFKN